MVTKLSSTMIPKTLAFILAAGGLLLAPNAFADIKGTAGRIVRMRVNTIGSDEHPLFHGSVTIRPPGSSQSVEYMWGGSTCPGQKLTESQIELLSDAFLQRHRTLVVPHFSRGEGNEHSCLVAFELIAG